MRIRCQRVDNSSNYRDILPDSYDTTGLWGPSEYDNRNALVINFLYALPFFKNQHELAGKLMGGWQLSGNFQFQSGVPCGIGTGNDTAGVGEVGSFGCGSEGQFWTMTGRPKLLKNFAGCAGQTGELEVTIDGISEIAKVGVVAIVRPNARHSVKALTDGRLIVVDHPGRADFG